jgi:hypothetical protein
MDLFAVLQIGSTIGSTPSYLASGAGGGSSGCTSFRLSAPNLPRAADVAGYYLVDEVTGEPFLIAHGMSSTGLVCVPYDRTHTLSAAHTYSIVAGYDPNVRRSGVNVEWTFAGRKHVALASALRDAGFDAANIPVWGFAAADLPANPTYDPLTKSYSADASQCRDFTLTIADNTPFTVNAPSNLLIGDRVLFVVRNASGAALGMITWDAMFKMAPWVSPAHSSCRSVQFRYDGTSLVEIGRTPADVPG